MDIFDALSLLTGIIPLLVISGIIIAIVMLMRRHQQKENDPGIGSLKRLYYYGLSFIALGVSAPGLILLIDFLLYSLIGPTELSRGQDLLALGLALSIVGIPVWFFHWWLALNSIRKFPGEAQVLSRQVYIYLVLGLSGALFSFGLVSFLRWLLGSGHFNGFNIAFLLVWTGIWGYHWNLQDLNVLKTQIGATMRRLYVYITSLYSLVMLALGVGIVIWRCVREAYAAVFTTKLLLSGDVSFWASLWTDTTRVGVAILVVGGCIWWWHWHHAAKGDTDSMMRQVYLYILAVFGGAVTVVITLSMVLFSVLQWIIGESESAGAASHFQGMPGILAALVPGAALWGYNWAQLQQESVCSSEKTSAVRRVYQYLVAALGLVTLSVGLAMVFLVAIGVLLPETESALLDTQWWRSPLMLGITLLAIGSPLWVYYWFGVQRQVTTGLIEERTAQSRHVFIYGVFGVATLLVLVNLSALLFIFLRDLLAAELSLQFLRDARWSIATIIMAGTISAYHWLIMKEDRRVISVDEQIPDSQVRVHKELIAMAPDTAQDLVLSLESLLEVPILIWRRLDGNDAPNLNDRELGAVRLEIINAPGNRALLIVDGSGVRVLPYAELP